MSQTFEGKRFLRLLRAHWAENWKPYAWFFAVAAILNGVFLALVFGADVGHQYFTMQTSFQLTWYTGGLFITGAVFATRYFDEFSNNGSTLIALMKPASVFEKWCLALLIVGLAFPVVYTLLYMGMNFPAIAYAKAHYVVLPASEAGANFGAEFQFYIPFFGAYAVSPLSGRQLLPTFAEEMVFSFKLLAVLALCMSGRVFFKRAAVLKTCLTVTGFLLVCFFLSAFLNANYSSAEFYWLGRAVSVDTSASPAHIAMAFAVLFGVPVMLWAALFFHIKEREVS